jgi:putative FmdB family regulatory protein
MPIFDYQCQKCNFLEEVIQKYTDQLDKKCPKCNEKMVKLISKSSFRLNGSGWYKTDFATTSKSSKQSS